MVSFLQPYVKVDRVSSDIVHAERKGKEIEILSKFWVSKGGVGGASLSKSLISLYLQQIII